MADEKLPTVNEKLEQVLAEESAKGNVPEVNGIPEDPAPRPVELTPELEAMGLTAEDIAATAEETTSSAQDAPAEETTLDPIRFTPQFQKAAHHIALMGTYSADEIGAMETAEVFRIGAIAGERVREQSVLRQQLAEALKSGEGARAPEAAVAEPQAELEAQLRKDLEPLFESLGDARGEEVLRSVLSRTAPAVRTSPPQPPVPVAPDPTVASEASRAAQFEAQVSAVRNELLGTFPQLSSDASMIAVRNTAEALSHSHSYPDLKSALEAGAMALFGKPLVTAARGSAARIKNEAARRLATPEPPAGATRSASKDAKLTPRQEQWRRFNATADLLRSGKGSEVRGRMG